MHGARHLAELQDHNAGRGHRRHRQRDGQLGAGNDQEGVQRLHHAHHRAQAQHRADQRQNTRDGRRAGDMF